MTESREDLVRAASAAFGRGDLNSLRDQFLAENISWHIAGTGSLAGDYEGAAQVMEFAWQDLCAVWWHGAGGVARHPGQQ